MQTFRQNAFSGGMNYLLEDTRLAAQAQLQQGNTPYSVTSSQYRLGFNVRTRFDVVSPIPSSVRDPACPSGLKQALLTVGNYLVVVIAGFAYYRLNTDTGWKQVNGFRMSPNAPRIWFVKVPLTTTLYGRVAGTTTIGANAYADAAAAVTQLTQTESELGNQVGILFQDGVNQPQFMFFNSAGALIARTTQNYSEWDYPLNPATLVLEGADKREYVPVGTYMKWYNGVLFIVDNYFRYLYRSVSGRPLDFVVNIDKEGQAGGDATTTSYSVGVENITALENVIGDSLFVAAGQSACFGVSFNQSNVAPKVFGEWTFNRVPLFNANCVSDLGIINILDDNVFIDADGIRSFKAVKELGNDGNNSVFSKSIQGLFTGITQKATVTGDGTDFVAAVVFDNYGVFSVKTIFGYVLVIYDIINKCWVSIDDNQTGGSAVKQFAVTGSDTLQLFAITASNELYCLYSHPTNHDVASVRLGAVCSDDPAQSIKLGEVRCVFTEMTENLAVTASVFVDNRYSKQLVATINYETPPANPVVDIGNDVGTQVTNIRFPFIDTAVGWKSFVHLSWVGNATLSNVSIGVGTNASLQPIQTQANIQ